MVHNLWTKLVVTTVNPGTAPHIFLMPSSHTIFMGNTYFEGGLVITWGEALFVFHTTVVVWMNTINTAPKPPRGVDTSRTGVGVVEVDQSIPSAAKIKCTAKTTTIVPTFKWTWDYRKSILLSSILLKKTLTSTVKLRCSSRQQSSW